MSVYHTRPRPPRADRWTSSNFRRLLAALSEPIELSGQLLKPSASIGVALFPAVGPDAEDVLSAADDAMYQAKRAGGGRVFLREGPTLREVVG